jgi:collagen type VII alpha
MNTMKRSAAFWLGAAGIGCLFLSAQCAQNGPGATEGNGGTPGGSAGTTGEGGKTGAAGTTGQAGTTETSGEGGKTTTGVAGTNGEGGSTNGEGGTTSGKGGTTGAAGATGAAGVTGTGKGGSTATGGSTGAAGTTGVAGTTGKGGSTGAAGSGSISVMDIVPDLVSFYWEGTCVGTTDPGGRNCPMFDKGSTCPTGSTYDQQGIIRDKIFNVKGVTGQKYTVTIDVRGVIGGRCYQNGTRASSAAASDTGNNNWWYVGGTQYNNSWWNTYELHVSPSTGDADVYYFNAADNPGGSYCEKEATYLVKYTASFKVVGGGTMKFTIHDSNCKAQQNCGSVASSTAPCAPRTVDLSGLTPAPPKPTMQPPTTVLSTTYYPQWMVVTATSVVATP